MANVLLAFLLKENVPVEEAENLVGKVKEKKMAELFANMEHMDIQAERRNTEEQRQRADKAEERADKAEERADKAEQELEKAKRMYSEAVKLFIENCQELSASKEKTMERLIKKFGFDVQQAQEELRLYWKK